MTPQNTIVAMPQLNAYEFIPFALQMAVWLLVCFVPHDLIGTLCYSAARVPRCKLKSLKNIRKITSLLVFFCMLFGGQLARASSMDKGASVWTRSLQLGGVFNTGNTDNESLSGQLSLKFDSDKWKHLGAFSMFLSQNEGHMDGRRYSFKGQSSYFLRPKRFLFASFSSVFDHFNPYEVIMTSAIGYGFRLVDQPKFFWSVQFGPGFRGSKQTESKTTESVVIFQPSSHVEWAVSDTCHFMQTFSADIGTLSNYYSSFHSESKLESSITANLSLQISYAMDYLSSIPQDSKNRLRLDTVTQISAIYKF